jgi:hypothetical protein
MDAIALIITARTQARRVAATNPSASLRLERQAARLENILAEQRRLTRLLASTQQKEQNLLAGRN